MSLIIINKKTMPNKAIIILSQSKGEIQIKTEGDFTKIFSNNNLIGINVLNYSKYFSATQGAHTLNKEQINSLEKQGIIIDDPKSKFVVGEVIEREVHPKSDRLFVLKVKTDKELKIVTNAKNAIVGKKVIVANIGATLPSGLEIVKSKVLGVTSEGMLCGGETLGKEKTEGVLIVNNNIGEEFII